MRFTYLKPSRLTSFQTATSGSPTRPTRSHSGLCHCWLIAMKDASLRRPGVLIGDGSVPNEEVLLQNQFGRLPDVTISPNGAFYLTTSHSDCYGRPRPEGDLWHAPGFNTIT